MDYKVIINGQFKSLNQYLQACGTHPQRGASMKRKDMVILEWEIRKQMPRVVLQTPVKFIYKFFEPNKRRDKSNTAAYFIKIWEDALQAVGALKNDNWSGVDSWVTAFYVDKQNPRIEVDIIEVGE